MNLDRSFYRFVTIHACDGQTDGRTDRILLARPRLHSMQRGKNLRFITVTLIVLKNSKNQCKKLISLKHSVLF